MEYCISNVSSRMKLPLTDDEFVNKLSINGDFSKKPSINGDSSKKPLINGDSSEKLLINGDYSKKPSINGDSSEKPSINGDSTTKPSIFVSKLDVVDISCSEKTQEAAFPSKKNQTEDGLYTLSNLDQIIPYLIGIIITFKKVTSDVDVGIILKQSLGKVLEEYYPLAGRVKLGSDGKMVVQCGGEEGGVPFVEAFSDGEMAAVVGDITAVDQEVVRKLLFSDGKSYETVLEVPPLAIQVTRFKCGGVILGVRFNHNVIDGRGFTLFMKSWGEFTREIPLSIPPCLDRSILSPRNPPKTHLPHPEYSRIERPLTPQLIPKEKVLVKSFRFTPSKLSQLKKLATDQNNNSSNNNEAVSFTPTAFELVSALSWIFWTRAKKLGPGETTQLATAVDGRKKLNPPVSEGYFGNVIVWSSARSTAEELTSLPFSLVVGIVHDAIKAVTGDYVRSTIDFHEMTKKPLELDNTLWITKWSRLALYEIDFGWGVASQVGPGAAWESLAVSHLPEKDSEDLILTIPLFGDAMEIFEELIQSMLS